MAKKLRGLPLPDVVFELTNGVVFQMGHRSEVELLLIGANDRGHVVVQTRQQRLYP
jgi:hypothetical protein